MLHFRGHWASDAAGELESWKAEFFSLSLVGNVCFSGDFLSLHPFFFGASKGIIFFWGGGFLSKSKFSHYVFVSFSVKRVRPASWVFTDCLLGGVP